VGDASGRVGRSPFIVHRLPFTSCVWYAAIRHVSWAILAVANFVVCIFDRDSYLYWPVLSGRRQLTDSLPFFFVRLKPKLQKRFPIPLQCCCDDSHSKRGAAAAPGYNPCRRQIAFLITIFLFQSDFFRSNKQ
jgi:hypothetical protein